MNLLGVLGSGDREDHKVKAAACAVIRNFLSGLPVEDIYTAIIRGGELGQPVN